MFLCVDVILQSYNNTSVDNDFLDLLEQYGFPPKVVLVKTGNNSSKVLADNTYKTVD